MLRFGSSEEVHQTLFKVTFNEKYGKGIEAVQVWMLAVRRLQNILMYPTKVQY